MTGPTGNPTDDSHGRRSALSTVAILALSATLLGACVGRGTGASGGSDGSGSPSASGGNAGGDGLPTDPDTLLLRVRTVGGFVMPGTDLVNLPQLSVYADGRVIAPGAQIAIYPAPLLPPLLVTRLSASDLRAMLTALADAGLASGTDRSYPPHGIADAPDTEIVVWSPTGTTTTRFGAFGIEQGGMDASETAARAAATAFLDRWAAPAGSGSSPYAPNAVRLIVREATAAPDLPQAPVAWPLATTLASAAPIVPGWPDGGGCLIVAGPDLETLWPLFGNANALTPWTQDGKSYSLQVRPLLPDEPRTCA